MNDWIPRPAEWVLPGHPDKLADAIADDLVAWARRRHDRALVGVEVAVHRDAVFVDGRIACPGARRLDVRSACARVFREAGYGGDFGPEPRRLKVTTDLDRGELRPGEAEVREVSDDQSIVTGWATTRSCWTSRRTARRTARPRSPSRCSTPRTTLSSPCVGPCGSSCGPR
jgi:S-adenosylmethionine synthetase